ncbi:AfsR/SARP family transcriptional regulator [Lentzea terrae]|uniref:AfsR/SARP family transcriptional regulator n=1 Tax=Lentzea terrae TaxID=2200761 RepID=UPI0018E511E0|nr:BTAD domain-containing putative transcriptional regulator [Lentzea terrae]
MTEIRLLGPLEVVTGSGERVRIGSTRDQKVLAALALASGRLVALDQLVAVAWDGDPPSTARHQVQKSIASLRAVLGASVIITDGTAYRVVASVDVAAFEDRVRSVVVLEPAQAAPELRAALELWRGPALAGLVSSELRVDADRWNERRIAVTEQCCALELGLGRHRELVPELTALVAEHPFREGLVALLMTALYRSDRQADALELYRVTHRRLVDELGVEPGPVLREAHEAVLAQDSGVVSSVVPRQLPADLVRFTGRAEHLQALDALLSSSTVVITSIAGVAGVGKTALAVHWAHRVSESFPDGQLYVNLRGFDDAPPITSAEALTGFLRALGVTQVPSDELEQAALYRSVLAQRRMLVLLDNAVSEDQVRPLLPGSPGCVVVVTSRNDLRGLMAVDDAHRLELDVLTPSESAALIGRMLGPARALAEPDAVATLARLCGHLPLALRVAAANLAASRDRVADAVAALEGEDRLSLLSIRGDQRGVVSAAFDLSYRELAPGPARLFRLLGLLPRNDFTVHTAAALLGESLSSAGACVAALEIVNLVEPHTAGRYRLHDLLHLYARGLGADSEAKQRMFDFYVLTADAALDLLMPRMLHAERPSRSVEVPPFGSRASALSWLDSERDAMVALALSGCWHMADALRRYLWMRSDHQTARAVATAALQHASQEGDLIGQATMESAIGTALMGSDAGAGAEHFTRAATLFRSAGDLVGAHRALHNLGACYVVQGYPVKALEIYREASAHQVGASETALVMVTVGPAFVASGDLHEAMAHYGKALELMPDDVPALGWTAEVALALGDVPRARDLIAQASSAAAGVPHWELCALHDESLLHLDTGASAQALAVATRLRDQAVRASANSHYLLRALDVIGNVQRHVGQFSLAIATLTQAVSVAVDRSVAYQEAWLRVSLARALLVSGDAEEAARHAVLALELALSRGFQVIRARALTLLSVLGQSRAEEALEIAMSTGHVLAQAEAWSVLGEHTRAAAIFERCTGSALHAPASVLSFEPSCTFCS